MPKGVLESMLRGEGTLVPHVQPMYRLSDNRLVALEYLAWHLDAEGQTRPVGPILQDPALRLRDRLILDLLQTEPSFAAWCGGHLFTAELLALVEQLLTAHPRQGSGALKEMAAKAGMIGITGTNARPSIAPTFGVENMLGTNPLTFAMPTDEAFPFFLDCATSVSQRGKIEVYDRIGKALPPGWVIGEDGQSRTDTHQILDDLVKGTASLTPLGGIGEDGGGYKGYGYATVVEILSAALQQGAFLKGLLGFNADGSKRPYHLGHFFIAIDIAAFIEPAEFKKASGEILRQLRNSKRAPGEQKIYTAGEKEYLNWLERCDKGVPVPAVLQKQMLQLKKELDLQQYKFPFETGA